MLSCLIIPYIILRRNLSLFGIPAVCDSRSCGRIEWGKIEAFRVTQIFSPELSTFAMSVRHCIGNFLAQFEVPGRNYLALPPQPDTLPVSTTFPRL